MSNSQLFPHQAFDYPLITAIDQKLISKIHKEVKKQYSVTGAWSDEQNLIYAQFIEDNPFEFQTAQKRRRFKVFQQMALKLPNRTAIQCRSHNQKIVKLAGTILKVPQYIKKRLSPQGRKQETPIEIRQEQKEANSQIVSSKFAQPIFEESEMQKSKQIKKIERFDLPLKLCIEIVSDRIEEYC